MSLMADETITGIPVPLNHDSHNNCSSFPSLFSSDSPFESRIVVIREFGLIVPTFGQTDFSFPST